MAGGDLSFAATPNAAGAFADSAQEVDLDTLSADPENPRSDAGGRALAFTDDIGADSAVVIDNFGADDSLRFTGSVGGVPVDADDVEIVPQGDAGAILRVNNDPTISEVDLNGFRAGLDVTTVAAFNALDVGNIPFG